MRDVALGLTEQLGIAQADSSLPVVVDDLVYRLGAQPILKHLSCEIKSGGCTAIIGYNGAGKSIFLRLLHGLIEPTSGRIRCGDLERNAARLRQAMVFQTPLMLRRSVAANVRYALAQHGVRGKAQTDRLHVVLEETNLNHLRKRAANVLSGGERQRVAVARALAPSPELVFLDEPTASLDPAATLAIEAILRRAMHAGTKLVLVTQSLGQAQRLATDVLFMHAGQITEHAAIDDFLRQPRSTAARAFIDGKLLTE